MSVKQLIKFGLIIVCCAANQLANSAVPAIGIDAHFRNHITGNPTWLLILRDENSGKTTPQLFTFNDRLSGWAFLAPGRDYRVTVSQLSFDNKNVINNFCQIQDGNLSGKSMLIRLSGTLSLNGTTCHILKYSTGL